MTSSNYSPRGDNASTYMVQNSKKKEELERLVVQSRMIMTALGGIEAEQPEIGNFHHVLDVACGTGEWVREAAQIYPGMTLVGIDINSMMIEYAQQQAQQQGVADRVEFQVMDTLKKLDFPDNSFDLVSLRLGVSFVRTWDWPPLLLELQRVVRPGGVIRLVELGFTHSSSQAVTKIYEEIIISVMYRAGHLFTQTTVGLTDYLEELLRQSWCDDVHIDSAPLVFRAGTPEGDAFNKDMKYAFQTTRPFVQKWIGISGNYDDLLQQARTDMEQADFSATMLHVTAWGYKPLTRPRTSTQAPVSSRHQKDHGSKASSHKSLGDDNASTYMVQSGKKKEELLRLVLQSRMITAATGGVLPEQPEANTLRRVLDIACGTGGWVLDAAQTYPEMSLVGVDISVLMTDYARTQAKEQGLTGRVEFLVMDALKKLDFPDNTFDLVNLRFGVSFVRTWEWAPLLLEMQRVVRPGGIIRLGESEIVTKNTSPALTALYDIAMSTFYRAGHLFTPETTGLTDHLAELLTKSWCENVQVKTYPLLFRAGTPEGEMYIEDVKYLHNNTTPFVRKWVGLPENYEALYQQALKEMKQADFSAIWPHHIVWGSKPVPKSKASSKP